MNKEILIQYADMKEEVKDIRKRIYDLKKQIEEMERGGCQVSDSVTGTRKDGTFGSIRITGFPLPEYSRKKTLLQRRQLLLQGKEEELLELLNQVEQFIENIPNSKTRILFRFYYIDDLNWIQVAHRMHSMFPKKKFTTDSCRKKHDRYLEKNLKMSARVR